MSASIIPFPDRSPVGEFIRNQRTPGTQRAYRGELVRFAVYLGGTLDTLPDVTKLDILAYREWLEDEGKANSTILRRLSVLRAFYAELKASGVIAVNPAERIKLPRKSRKKAVRSLSLAEINQFLLVIPRTTLLGKRDYAVFRLLLGNAGRVGETCSATVGDLSEELGHHVLWMARAKNDEQRKLALKPTTYSAILDYLGARGFTAGGEIHGDWREQPLFMRARPGGGRPRTDGTAHEGQALTPSAVWARFQHYGTLAGLPKDVCHPHTLRRTAITWAIKSGADVRSVQAMAGHKSLMTTSGYADDVAGLDENAAYKLPY